MHDFTIKEFDYDKRTRNLTNKAQGVVESTKYFPVFIDETKELIFKPLSKTKPYQTPLFAYSEVYWSYLINKYINKNTPVYNLAYCRNLSQNQPKYYEKGCVVENILNDQEELVNLLEFFRKYPDSSVDIDNYINYCEVQYDYEPILRSNFFIANEELSKTLAEQILCAILRRDDNYHYENVALVFKNSIPIRMSPIIDLEFSQFFMFPDEKSTHKLKFSQYDEGMMPIFKYDDEKSYEENLERFKRSIIKGSIYNEFSATKEYLVMRNIKTITELYPDVASEFIKKINHMKKEIEEFDINFNQEFLGSFSSKDYHPTRMLLKEKVTDKDPAYLKAKELALKSRITLDTTSFNQTLKKEVFWHIDKLTMTIDFFLNLQKGIYPDIRNYQNKTLYNKVNRIPEVFLEDLFNMIKEDKEKIKEKKV